MDKELEALLQKEISEFDVDWYKILSKLLKKRKFVICTTAVFAVLGFVWSLISVPLYESKAILAPEAPDRTPSSVTALTNMLGVDTRFATGVSPDALNMSLFPNISASTNFLAQLLDVKVTPYIDVNDKKLGVCDSIRLYDYVQIPKGVLGKTVAFFLRVEPDNGPINPLELTSRQAKSIKNLKASISTTVNENNGIATIKVKSPDPLVAWQLTDYVCKRLQNTVIDYRTQKEQSVFEYYTRMTDDLQNKQIQAENEYARSVDSDHNVTLQSVRMGKDRLKLDAQIASDLYREMLTRKEVARSKVQEVKPVFALIEPASMPNGRASGKWTKLILLTALGLILSISYVYSGDFLKLVTKKVSESKE